MKKLFFTLFLLLPSPVFAANCNSFPFTLVNGQVADANQVMANFNNLLTCANTSLAHNGPNSDITSLSALSTPLSVNQGGTGLNSAGPSGNFLQSNGSGWSSQTLPQPVPSGVVAWTAAPSAVPGGWDACDGSAHSRTAEAALFGVIGTAYGAGDGATTFNVPDARGRAIFGFDLANGTGRLNNSTGQGISAAAVSNTGGSQSHSQTTAEVGIHGHTATVTDPGHSHQVSGSNVAAGTFPAVGSFSNGTGSVGSSSTNTTGITVAIANAGAGTPFNIVPPGLVLQCIIKQ